MVVRFNVQKSRGAAGQSVQGPKTGYNFSNLYAMNRSDDQIQNKANQMQQGANQVDVAMRDAKNKATGRQDKAGDAQAGTNMMAQAVNKAKGISDQSDSFSVTGSMVKAGASPRQAAIGSFYAGGDRSAGARQIKGFSNLYSQALGKQADLQTGINNGIADSIATTPGKVDPKLSAYEQNIKDTDERNTRRYDVSQEGERQVTGNVNNMNNLDNLTWMLKTGRISNEEYYKAQQDPAFYDILMKKGQ